MKTGKKSNQKLYLAIEASGITCGAALSSDTILLGEYYTAVPHKHDELLAEYVSRLFSDNGVSMENLDGVIVSAGPGSFTGLRIGTALAKGLLLGSDNCPLYAVSSLLAVAYSLRPLALTRGVEAIHVVAPSHKNLFYLQEFSTDAIALAPPALVEKETLTPDENVLYGGVGLDASFFSKKIQPEASFLPAFRPSLLFLQMNDAYLRPHRVAPDVYTPLYGQEFIPPSAR